MQSESNAEIRRKRRMKRKRRKKIIKILLLLFLIILAIIFGFVLFLKKGEHKPYTIGLDAGHGGEDVGAIGYIEEVELTEKTTDFLQELLEKDGRFKVVRSRKNGEDIGITKRKEILLKQKPDLILSIHGNSDPTGTARGFECYPSPPGRYNHEISYYFAVCIAESMAEVGNHLRGENGVRYAYYVTDQNGNTQKAIKEISDTMVYAQQSFGMVENLKCPSVLVEQCFVTNQQDVEQFGSEMGCKLAASAYYKAICKYLGIKEISSNI